MSSMPAPDRDLMSLISVGCRTAVRVIRNATVALMMSVKWSSGCDLHGLRVDGTRSRCFQCPAGRPK